MSLLWPSLLCAALALGLTAAEFRSARRWEWWLKPAASVFFIIQALVAGALGSLYGCIILTALVLSAAGDVLLLPRDRPRTFLVGMAAFAVAHVAYIMAFLSNTSTSTDFVLLSWPLGLTTLFLLPAQIWLLPRAAAKDRLAIISYTMVIGAMVLFALHPNTGMTWLVMLAALMFAVSDMAVARDRFVPPSRWNCIVITPLYYGAQCLFALSV